MIRRDILKDKCNSQKKQECSYEYDKAKEKNLMHEYKNP